MLPPIRPAFRGAAPPHPFWPRCSPPAAQGRARRRPRRRHAARGGRGRRKCSRRPSPVEFEYPAQTAGSREVEVRARVRGHPLQAQLRGGRGGARRASRSSPSIRATSRPPSRAPRPMWPPPKRAAQRRAAQRHAHEAALRGQGRLAEGLRRRRLRRRGRRRRREVREGAPRRSAPEPRVHARRGADLGRHQPRAEERRHARRRPADLLTTVSQVDPDLRELRPLGDRAVAAAPGGGGRQARAAQGRALRGRDPLRGRQGLLAPRQARLHRHAREQRRPARRMRAPRFPIPRARCVPASSCAWSSRARSAPTRSPCRSAPCMEVAAGQDGLRARSPTTRPMPRPVTVGDWTGQRLDRHLGPEAPATRSSSTGWRRSSSRARRCRWAIRMRRRPARRAGAPPQGRAQGRGKPPTTKK